jgi:hypothetical protein
MMGKGLDYLSAWGWQLSPNCPLVYPMSLASALVEWVRQFAYIPDEVVEQLEQDQRAQPHSEVPEELKKLLR